LLLAWSTLFRSKVTFSNYLGYVKTGCLLAKASSAVFDDPALKRAKVSIDKSRSMEKRKAMFVQRPILEKLVQWSQQVEHPQAVRDYIMFLLFCYAFLLRVPSEGVPVVAGERRPTDESPVMVYRHGDTMTLHMKRRKNKLGGSILTRGCWCKESEATCPIHAIGPFIDRCPIGERPFGHVTAQKAVRILRVGLAAVGVQNAIEYRTHDLRRGHAEDLRRSGLFFVCPLYSLVIFL